MEEDTGPVAAISQNDLIALTSILSFYKRWLQRTMAPSIKKNGMITEVQLLIVKVSLLASSKIAIVTFHDVEYLTSAISTFSQQVREKIPLSKGREEILESCEGLRSYIVATFKPDKA